MFQKPGERQLGQPAVSPKLPYPKIPEAWQRLRSSAEFFYAMYLKKTGQKLAKVEIVFSWWGVPKIIVYPGGIKPSPGPSPTPPRPSPIPQSPPNPGVSGFSQPKVIRTPRTGETYFHGKVKDIYNPYESI